MRVYPGIENILEKLTLSILLSKIEPQNFGKVVHMNENALRSLNLAWTLGSYSTSTFAYLKILNSGLPVEIFDMCCNKHGYDLKLISERFLMQFGCFLIIKKLYNDESTVQVFWLKTL